MVFPTLQSISQESVYKYSENLNSYFTEFDGYYSESLNVIACLSIASAIYVILSKNPIVSVLFLIFLFLTISLYLMLLGVNFIGLSYLLVYVGAVSILFLFILMLINIRISEIITTTSNSMPLAIIISILFMYTIYPALPANKDIFSLAYGKNNLTGIGNTKSNLSAYSNTYMQDSNVNFNSTWDSSLFHHDNFNITSSTTLLFTWDTMLADTGHINSIGNVLYTVYPLWIILTSLVLLLAMVGCILITVK